MHIHDTTHNSSTHDLSNLTQAALHMWLYREAVHSSQVTLRHTMLAVLLFVLSRQQALELRQCFPVCPVGFHGRRIQPSQKRSSDAAVTSSRYSPVNNVAADVRLSGFLVKPVDHLDHGEALGYIHCIGCVTQDIENLPWSNIPVKTLDRDITLCMHLVQRAS